MNKINRAWWSRPLRPAAGVIFLVVMAGAGLDAATLYNNGSIGSSPSYSSNSPSDSTNTGNTVFDNFTTGTNGWIVTGFDITDWFVNSTPGNRNINWSIWSGAPLLGGTLVASGVGSGVLGSLNGQNNCGNVGFQCYAMLTVTLSSGTFLAANTSYWLGTSVVASGGSDTTDRVFTTTAGNGWEQASGSDSGVVGSKWSNQGCGPTSTCSSTGDTAFDILGTLAPEPGTLTLMGLALLGLGYKIRRRKA